jgi:hypothetical protein
MACRISGACCNDVVQGGEVTKVLVEAALDRLAAQCLVCPALHTQQVGQQVHGACAAFADYRAVRSTNALQEVGRQTLLTPDPYREVPAMIRGPQLLLPMQLLGAWTDCS